MSTFLTTGALVEDVTCVVASASTVYLSSISPTLLRVTGNTAGMFIRLPDARTLVEGMKYVFMNEASVSVTLQNASGSSSTILAPSSTTTAYLIRSFTLAGEWVYAGGSGSIGSNLTLTAGEDLETFSPVCIGSDGKAYTVDIANPILAFATCGLSLENVGSGDSFSVQTNGLVANVTNLPQLYGMPTFISGSRSLTYDKPDIENGFNSGDFVIFMGVTKKNDTTANVDLILNIKVTGVL